MAMASRGTLGKMLPLATNAKDQEFLRACVAREQEKEKEESPAKRPSKAARATTYHTTGIPKPSIDDFGCLFDDEYDQMTVFIDYGKDDPTSKDPDCRYIVGTDGVAGLKVWADDTKQKVKYNTRKSETAWFDVKTKTTKIIQVNRQSVLGEYKLHPRTGWPLNPKGRTGVVGPGKLGCFGPNHAGDPIVARKIQDEPRIIEIVLILRKDTDEWAIPGGMVDPGEPITVAIKREFGEEANAGGMSKELDECFQKAAEIWRGVVDDPRNTDNSWMETIVRLIDASEVPPEKLQLKSGSDAADVAWGRMKRDEDGNLVVTVRGKVVQLYASHADFVSIAYDWML